ncbi:MAG: hypothetical protein ACR2LR_28795 [Hassallia sp.]
MPHTTNKRDFVLGVWSWVLEAIFSKARAEAFCCFLNPDEGKFLNFILLGDFRIQVVQCMVGALMVGALMVGALIVGIGNWAFPLSPSSNSY